jgi:hypothetical protein
MPESENVQERIARLTGELKIQLENEKNQRTIVQVDEIEKDNKSEAWGEPEDLLRSSDLLPVQKFDVSLLPDGFAEMVADTSYRMQVPPDLIAIPLIGSLSSLIAGRINIRPKQEDDWTVVCNLWGVIIGLPSLLKTPCAQEAMAFLRALEVLACNKHEDESLDYIICQEGASVLESEKKTALRSALKSKDEVRIAETEQSYKEFLLAKREEPVAQRYILGDSTIEKTQEIQSENQGRCLMLFRDELSGFLHKLDACGRENDRAYLLESWDGHNSFTSDTIGRGSKRVDKNILSIFGTSQPAPWRNFLNDTINSTYKNDGFPQRFQLAVYPDAPREWKIVDKKPDINAMEQVCKVFEYIDQLDPQEIGAKGEEGHYYLNFTPDAQVIFNNWLTRHENWVRGDNGHPDYLNIHFTKYRSLVPSLALIIHIANMNKGDVDEHSVVKAIEWSNYLTSHAFRLYGNIAPVEEQAAQLIARRLLRSSYQESLLSGNYIERVGMVLTKIQQNQG